MPGTWFARTRWSVVLEARSSDPAAARRALEELCRTYWYPLYAFLRRRGHPHDEAEDLVQGLFCALLDGDGLARADREKGKFRSYLLGALRHHVSNRRQHDGATKRGGGRPPLSIDLARTAGRYDAEPVERCTPEQCFERDWAVALLDQAFDLLRRRHAARGREGVFAALKRFVGGEGTHEELAAALGMSPGSTRVLVHRFRRELGEVVREVVAQTVDSPAAADEELASLIGCFGPR